MKIIKEKEVITMKMFKESKEYFDKESKLQELLMSELDNTSFDDINSDIMDGKVDGVEDVELASRDDDFDMYEDILHNGIKDTSSMYDFAKAFVALSDMDDYSLYNIAKDKPLTLSELQLVLNWTMFRASEALEEERRQYKQTSIQAVVDFSEEYPELDMYFDVVASNNKLKLIEK